MDKSDSQVNDGGEPQCAWYLLQIVTRSAEDKRDNGYNSYTSCVQNNRSVSKKLKSGSKAL